MQESVEADHFGSNFLFSVLGDGQTSFTKPLSKSVFFSVRTSKLETSCRISTKPAFSKSAMVLYVKYELFTFRVIIFRIARGTGCLDILTYFPNFYS